MRLHRGCYHLTVDIVKYNTLLCNVSLYTMLLQEVKINLQQRKEKGGYLEWGWGPRRVGEWPISRSWLEVREACRGRSLACALSPSLGVLCLLAMSQPCNTGKANQNGLRHW